MFLKSFLLSVLIVFNVSIEDEDVQSRDIWGCNVAEADYDRGAVPFRVCSSPVEMVEWDNETLVGIFEDVESELECWGACEQEPACNFYSFSSQAASSVASSCRLLSQILGPFAPCQGCATGPVDCFMRSDHCMFLHGGVVANTLILSDPSQVSELRTAALGCCNMVAIAVGGGGSGSNNSGGGSGYIEWAETSIAGHFALEARVGQPSQPSALTWAGRKVVQAAQGVDADSFDGGDGYSGGGAAGGEGGSDGSNGGDGSGGRGGIGSGLSLEDIASKSFRLTPGMGGLTNGKNGGGGGGVLVNGDGPGEAGDGVGEGFGGGGSEDRLGFSGVVMLSFE